jgi:hypothetical protein
MRELVCATLFAMCAALAGCGAGAGDLVPATGTITVDDKPGAGVVVQFVPKPGTPGNGGTAVADESGKYEMATPQGKKGLPPGEYAVVLSYRRNADGSAPDPNVPPIESGATERLPKKYSDRDATELKATVAAGAPPHNFAVTTGKKK